MISSLFKGTNKYATMDLEMKQKALAKAKPLGDEIAPEFSWKEDPDILAWLESLQEILLEVSYSFTRRGYDQLHSKNNVESLGKNT